MTSTGSLTYHDLVEAPRPQAGILSPDGKRTINVVNQWDNAKQQMIKTIYVINIPDWEGFNADIKELEKPSPIKLFSCPAKEAGSFFWLSETHIGYLSNQTVKYLNLPLDFAGGETKHNEIFTFPTSIEASFLTVEFKNGLLAFSAKVWEKDGNFETVEENTTKDEDNGNGVRYDELFIRYKDKWRVPGKVYTLGLVKLVCESDTWSTGDIKGKKFWNALQGTGLYSQIPSISSSTITLSSSHLVIATEPPKLSPPLDTRMDIYVFPLDISDGPLTALPTNLTCSHDHGEVEYLNSSDDGNRIVWTERETNRVEASKRNVYTWDFKQGRKTQWVKVWDASPSEVTLSKDGKSLFWLSQTKGRNLPYFIPGPEQDPVPLHTEGVTESITELSGRGVLISKNDMFNPLNDYIVNLPEEDKANEDYPAVQLTDWSSSFFQDKMADMKLEEFWFENDQGRRVMAWVNKPKGFDNCQDRKTYPMVLNIHGGPQSAMRNMWPIRWNPTIYAAYGYLVLSINPTGSTGYGQQFIDELQYELGGRDVNDLEKGYKAALAQYPQIDPERTAAIGASSALICHAGVFDETQAAYETEGTLDDSLWNATLSAGCSDNLLIHATTHSRNAGIDPNTDPFKSVKYNPADYINKWKTPTLVIHGGKDFRVPESNAICAFTALQWRGVPSRLLYFPDEGHKPETPNNVEQWYREIFQFLDEWIGH